MVKGVPHLVLVGIPLLVLVGVPLPVLVGVTRPGCERGAPSGAGRATSHHPSTVEGVCLLAGRGNPTWCR